MLVRSISEEYHAYNERDKYQYKNGAAAKVSLFSSLQLDLTGKFVPVGGRRITASESETIAQSQ
jgi:hypothetical protein